MKLLTDTDTLVWALSNPEALGRAARTALAGSPFTASVKTRKPGALVANPLPWWDKYNRENYLCKNHTHSLILLGSC